jgi:PAS domain S-box-containing protein
MTTEANGRQLQGADPRAPLARPDRGTPADLPAVASLPPPPAAQPSRQARASRPASARLPETATTAALTREWVIMAPIMGLALLIMGLATWSLPPLRMLASAGLAMVVAGVSAWLMERLGTGVRGIVRQGLAALLVAMPLAAFGAAIAGWAWSGPANWWLTAIGVLVVTGTVSSVLVAGRLPQVVLGNIAIWMGPVATTNSFSAFALLAFGVGIGLIAMRRQRERDRLDAERHQALERVQMRAEGLLAEYEQTGQGWFWEIDRRGAITYVSPAIGRVIGRDGAALIGRQFGELFVLDNGGQEGERTLAFHLSTRSSFQDLAVRAAAAGEEERWWSISGRPVYDAFDNFVGFRGSGTDLTEKRKSEQHATRLAHYDSLTSLANRFQMSQSLEKILNAHRQEHRCCAVMLLDLDRFKQVNDTMGTRRATPC